MYTSACRFDRGVPAQQRLLWYDQQSAFPFLHTKYKLHAFACRTTTRVTADWMLLLHITGRPDSTTIQWKPYSTELVVQWQGTSEWQAFVCLLFGRNLRVIKECRHFLLGPTIAVATPVTCRTRMALCIYHNTLRKGSSSPFPFGDRTVVSIIQNYKTVKKIKSYQCSH